jgi:hypothetical protein
MKDNVNHPSHYAAGKIEVIEAIEDWKLDFHSGNVVKYVARAGKKDPTKEIEDLEKGRWYLNRRIELLKAAKEDRIVVRPNDMDRVEPNIKGNHVSLDLTVDEKCHLHGHEWVTEDPGDRYCARVGCDA